MKKGEISAALDALKQIKMPKVSDKELRNTLIDNHFNLLDAGKKADAEIENRRKVFLAAYKAESEEINDLQQELSMTSDRERQLEITRKINSHKDYLAAVKEFNESVKKLHEEPVEGIIPINRKAFMDAIRDMDNMSLSWVEALYPLFETETE
jgi:hypothetical protein